MEPIRIRTKVEAPPAPAVAEAFYAAAGHVPQPECQGMRSVFRTAPLFFVVLVPALAATAAAPEVRLADSLQPFVDNHTLAGAVVLVADRDKVLDLEAVGYADVAAGTPMKTDDLFWIASMSKPITATGLMMLVDEGKVKLDDPVEKYLPEFKDQWVIAEQDKDHMLLKRPTHPITVRNILSHTSGLPSHVGDGDADARPAAAARRRAQLRHDAAPVRSGQPVSVFQRGHQHGRPHHRGRQRNAV